MGHWMTIYIDGLANLSSFIHPCVKHTVSSMGQELPIYSIAAHLFFLLAKASFHQRKDCDIHHFLCISSLFLQKENLGDWDWVVAE